MPWSGLLGREPRERRRKTGAGKGAGVLGTNQLQAPNWSTVPSRLNPGSPSSCAKLGTSISVERKSQCGLLITLPPVLA